MCTLWQRFGRAARDPELDAIAILFVEPSRTDGNKEAKEARKERRDIEKGKRKASDGWTQGRATKRVATGAQEMLVTNDGMHDERVPVQVEGGTDRDHGAEVRNIELKHCAYH
jgi:hypothetical protein